MVAVTGLLAAGAGAASAEPVPDSSRTIRTDDGWKIKLIKTREFISRTPNLAATMFTREGFLDLRAVAKVDGHARAGLQGGNLAVGIQVGCQIDVSSGLQMGLQVGFGPWAGVTVAQSPAVNFGAGLNITPSVGTTVKPGGIVVIPLATKPLAGPKASITIDQAYIKVDACMGPVSLRSFVSASVSTNPSDNHLTVYGPPIYL